MGTDCRKFGDGLVAITYVIRIRGWLQYETRLPSKVVVTASVIFSEGEYATK